LNLWEIKSNIFVHEYKKPLRELRKITTNHKHEFVEYQKILHHIYNKMLLMLRKHIRSCVHRITCLTVQQYVTDFTAIFSDCMENVTDCTAICD